MENTRRKKILIRYSKLMSKGTDWRNKRTHDLQNLLSVTVFIHEAICPFIIKKFSQRINSHINAWTCGSYFHQAFSVGNCSSWIIVLCFIMNFGFIWLCSWLILIHIVCFIVIVDMQLLDHHRYFSWREHVNCHFALLFWTNVYFMYRVIFVCII